MLYCPICGKILPERETMEVPPLPGFKQHRCSDRATIALDAAMRRDPDTEEPRARTYGQRLHEGFKMLESDD